MKFKIPFTSASIAKLKSRSKFFSSIFKHKKKSNLENTLKNLYIEDQKSDTLLYAERVTANLRNISRQKKQIIIKNITLHNAFINFSTDSTGQINLKFIIDYFRNPDPEKKQETPWKIRFSDVAFHNSRFCYSADVKKDVPAGINFSEMDMRDLNIKLNDFTINIARFLAIKGERLLALKMLTYFSLCEFDFKRVDKILNTFVHILTPNIIKRILRKIKKYRCR